MQCIYQAAKALKNGAFGALSLFVIKIRHKKPVTMFIKVTGS